MDMPRARTQLGRASWADTLSVLAVVIHAIPASTMAGTATYTLGAQAITPVAAACTSVPRSTSASRGMAWRRRGKNSAATMAPAPMLASSSVKVPAPPPSSPLATSGSRAMRAVACRKKTEMRHRTARMRGDWRTNCTPTRMALGRRSRPSGLGMCSRFQRMMTRPESTDSTALSTNTQALPALAMMAPASSGPTMREAFMATPFSARAAGNCGRLTSSGTMAANTGQRMASPMPLAKVSASSSGAVMPPETMAKASTTATAATQNCVAMK